MSKKQLGNNRDLGHPATRGEIKKYNKDDPREYFEQCFEKQRKIGEGSFGEVRFLYLISDC